MLELNVGSLALLLQRLRFVDSAGQRTFERWNAPVGIEQTWVNGFAFILGKQAQTYFTGAFCVPRSAQRIGVEHASQNSSLTRGSANFFCVRSRGFMEWQRLAIESHRGERERKRHFLIQHVRVISGAFIKRDRASMRFAGVSISHTSTQRIPLHCFEPPQNRGYLIGVRL